MSKKRKESTSLERPVFEVSLNKKRLKIHAASAAELKLELAKIWPDMADYSLQAAAHLAFAERLLVGDKMRGVQRIGVLKFEPDMATDSCTKKAAQEVDNDTSSVPENSTKSEATEAQKISIMMPDLLR